MNKKKMLELAKYIENLPEERFNMGSWLYSPYTRRNRVVCESEILSESFCGTTCCIAGWQAIKEGKCLDNVGMIFEKKEGSVDNSNMHASDYAAESLGLPTEQEYKLFYQNGWPSQFLPATNKNAAKRIRYMVRTGR